MFRRNLPEGPLPVELIQVSFDISTQKTRNRELNGLLAGAKALKCDKLTLITFDTAETDSINGRTIEIVPVIETGYASVMKSAKFQNKAEKKGI